MPLLKEVEPEQSLSESQVLRNLSLVAVVGLVAHFPFFPAAANLLFPSKQYPVLH